MREEAALDAVARKLIDKLGPDAPVRMSAIVAAHAEAGDAEGVKFWSDVALAVGRLVPGGTLRSCT